MSNKEHINRMKKNDLRDELESIHGYNPEGLKSLKRPELITLLRENRLGKQAQDALDNVDETVSETIEKTDDQKETQEQSSVLQTDPKWTAYVLNQFEDDELTGENPRVDGLRRVTELLIGNIMEERTEVIECPSVQNGFRAVVVATIIINSYRDGLRTYDGAADVSSSNCEQEYARFPISMAETRARGRAFRTALKLRQTVAAEEMTSVPVLYSMNPGAINPSQISAIRILCDRGKISIAKMLHHLEIDKNELKNLTQEEGIICMKNLNEWRQNPDGMPEQLLRN